MERVGKIRKGDKVKVIAGKEKGKIGSVLRVSRDLGMVFVEKLNMVKRHQKSGRGKRQGGMIEKEAPIHASNVMVMCGKCVSPVRIKKRILDDGKKVRICAKCDEIMDT